MIRSRRPWITFAAAEFLDDWTASAPAQFSVFEYGSGGSTLGTLGVTCFRSNSGAPQTARLDHLYVVRAGNRDELVRGLAEHGIQALVHYPRAVHRHEAYRHLARRLRVSESLCDEVLSIPLYPELRDLIEVSRAGRPRR